MQMRFSAIPNDLMIIVQLQWEWDKFTYCAEFPIESQSHDAGSADAAFAYESPLRRRRKTDDAVRFVAAADRQRRERRSGVDARLSGLSNAGSGNRSQGDGIFLVDFRNIVGEDRERQRMMRLTLIYGFWTELVTTVTTTREWLLLLCIRLTFESILRIMKYMQQQRQQQRQRQQQKQ